MMARDFLSETEYSYPDPREAKLPVWAQERLARGRQLLYDARAEQESHRASLTPTKHLVRRTHRPEPRQGLPPGWEWTSTRIEHTTETHARDGIEEQTSTRVVAMFTVTDAAMNPVRAHGGAAAAVLSVQRIEATWFEGRLKSGGPKLTGVELSGPVLDRNGVVMPKRRASYLAYCNEIGRARNGGEPSTVTREIITGLDDWAAHNMPAVVVS